MSLHSSTEVSCSDRCTDRLRLVRKKVLGLVPSTPQHPMAHTVIRHCLRCSLLYGTLNRISSCDELDSAIEQVHSPFARTLQGHHRVSLHKACEFQPAMLSRSHAHETFLSYAFPPTSRAVYLHRRSSPLSITRQQSKHYVGNHASCDHCDGYRSNDGCVEL